MPSMFLIIVLTVLARLRCTFANLIGCCHMLRFIWTLDLCGSIRLKSVLVTWGDMGITVSPILVGLDRVKSCKVIGP